MIASGNVAGDKNMGSAIDFRKRVIERVGAEKFAEYTYSNIHVDAMLSQFSIAYKQAGFIAERVLLPVKVKKKSDKYPVWGRENFQVPQTLRASGAKANIVKQSLSNDSYFCEEHALKTFVTKDERENQDDGLRLEEAAVAFVTQLIQLRKELKANALLFTAANYPAASKTDISGTQWNNNANTPFRNIKTAMRAVARLCGKLPNTIIIPGEVMDVLEEHDDFLDRTKYSSRDALTSDILANLLRLAPGGPGVVIGESVQNTEQEGETEVMADIWNSHVLVAYIDPNPALETQTLGVGFTTSDGRETRRWMEEETDNDWFQVLENYDHKLVSTQCGHLLTDVVA